MDYDLTDVRCPECGDIRVGDFQQHRAWCPTLRRPMPAEQPPPPGPIWTNGVADDQPERPYTDVQLAEARGELLTQATNLGYPLWITWALGFITASADKEPMSPTQQAMAAAVAEVTTWHHFIEDKESEHAPQS